MCVFFLCLFCVCFVFEWAETNLCGVCSCVFVCVCLCLWEFLYGVSGFVRRCVFVCFLRLGVGVFGSCVFVWRACICVVFGEILCSL